MDENNTILSLLDDNNNEGVKIASKLDVVKMEFVQPEIKTWHDLFDGYDDLKAITFSSGINFVYEIINQFNQVEIIFGCEGVMSYTLKNIMAYQERLIEKMRVKASKAHLDVLSRIDDGTVRFFVARGKLSHEKLYLLSASDGRKRVVTGSANMSFNAFGGMQRENICYMDGDEAYNWYLSCFEELKSDSSDSISHKAFLSSDLEENIEDLPIFEPAKSGQIIELVNVEEYSDEVEFVLDVEKAASKISPCLPKTERKLKKIIIQMSDVMKMKRNIINTVQQDKELRSEYPQLILNIEKGCVELNGKLLNLNPASEDISNDVNLFLKYMNGFKCFHGDIDSLQHRYFEFANWFFCSPFMATMRDTATRFDHNKFQYPVFGLLYGQSKAGKTSFLETLLKMMIGQKPKIMASEFTRKNIEGLKNTVKGAPIIVDDLTQSRFGVHAIETIKSDDFGVREHMIDYPAVVISANEDVKAVAQEVIRRTVICRVEAGLTNTEVMKSSLVRQVQKKIGTSFYREYLRRMFEVVPELIEQLKDDENSEAPDILSYSASIIVDIINEFSDDVPEYIRPLTIEDYFSEKVTGKHAINVIQTAWRTNKKSFVINNATDELRYNFGDVHEANRILKELPETLEVHKSRDCIIMNLTEAKGYFGIQFKKGLFG